MSVMNLSWWIGPPCSYLSWFCASDNLYQISIIIHSKIRNFLNQIFPLVKKIDDIKVSEYQRNNRDSSLQKNHVKQKALKMGIWGVNR